MGSRGGGGAPGKSSSWSAHASRGREHPPSPSGTGSSVISGCIFVRPALLLRPPMRCATSRSGHHRGEHRDQRTRTCRGPTQAGSKLRAQAAATFHVQHAGTLQRRVGLLRLQPCARCEPVARGPMIGHARALAGHTTHLRVRACQSRWPAAGGTRTRNLNQGSH